MYGVGVTNNNGSRFDDWVYWHFFTITVDYNSSHIELLLNDVSLKNLSLNSDWSLLHSNARISSFYNCRAALIEVTMSKGSTTAFHECVVSETCVNRCLTK
jgi:hypothetical protein